MEGQKRSSLLRACSIDAAVPLRKNGPAARAAMAAMVRTITESRLIGMAPASRSGPTGCRPFDIVQSAFLRARYADFRFAEAAGAANPSRSLS